MEGFRNILVATDFSPAAEAALKQGVWLARVSGARLTLVHTLPDLRKVVHYASAKAKLDLLYGEGHQFEREVRRPSDARLKQAIAALQAPDLDIQYETLIGDPVVEIVHAVQQEGYDLVLVGTRGRSVWERFFVGSTAKRLIRKCPSAVWIVKAEHSDPPHAILALTDFSDVSRRALLAAAWVAQRASAALHLLHVIDSSDVPDDLIEKLPQGGSLREEIRSEAQQRLAQFLAGLPVPAEQIHSHLSWGTPWKEIARLAQHEQIDLIALGTVGRSGVAGILLGNTAEKVLDTCDCSVLTVKPEGFVSPIQPACWPLHPGPSEDERPA